MFKEFMIDVQVAEKMVQIQQITAWL